MSVHDVSSGGPQTSHFRSHVGPTQLNWGRLGLRQAQEALSFDQKSLTLSLLLFKVQKSSSYCCSVFVSVNISNSVQPLTLRCSIHVYIFRYRNRPGC